MALAQYNYPQSTGLQQLGDVLMKGSGDYANVQLQRQAEERRQAQRLAEMQDQRRFLTEQRGVERGYKLSDEQRRQEQAVEDARFEARLASLARAAKLGLFSERDLGKIEVEDAALAKLAEREGTERTRLDETLAGAQSELNRLASDRDLLSEKEQEIAGRLRDLQQAYNATAEMAQPMPVTREAVELKAAELARAADVKLATEPSKRGRQLAPYLGQAEEALNKEALLPAVLAQNRLKSISNQYNSLVREQGAVSDQVRNIRQTMSDLQRQFPIAPVRAARTPAQAIDLSGVDTDTDVTEVPPGLVTPQDRESVRDQLRGPQQPPPPPPPPPPGTDTQALVDPSLAPATSIKGIGQRLPSLVPEFLAVPGRAIDTGSRLAAAGLRGLWEGDFTVPQYGPVELAGQEIGRRLSNKPLPGDYMSAERARVLGLQRSSDLPPLPPRTPSSAFANIYTPGL